jgi:hypothetical protein
MFKAIGNKVLRTILRPETDQVTEELGKILNGELIICNLSRML